MTVGSDDHHFAKAGEINTGFLNFGTHTTKWPDQAHCPGAAKAVCTSVLPFRKSGLLNVYIRSHAVSSSNPSMIPSELLMKSRLHQWLIEPSVCLLLWFRSWDHTRHDHLLDGWQSLGSGPCSPLLPLFTHLQPLWSVLVWEMSPVPGLLKASAWTWFPSFLQTKHHSLRLAGMPLSYFVPYIILSYSTHFSSYRGLWHLWLYNYLCDY